MMKRKQGDSVKQPENTKDATPGAVKTTSVVYAGPDDVLEVPDADATLHRGGAAVTLPTSVYKRLQADPTVSVTAAGGNK